MSQPPRVKRQGQAEVVAGFDRGFRYIASGPCAGRAVGTLAVLALALLGPRGTVTQAADAATGNQARERNASVVTTSLEFAEQSDLIVFANRRAETAKQQQTLDSPGTLALPELTEGSTRSELGRSIQSTRVARHSMTDHFAWRTGQQEVPAIELQEVATASEDPAALVSLPSVQPEQDTAILEPATLPTEGLAVAKAAVKESDATREGAGRGMFGVLTRSLAGVGTEKQGGSEFRSTHNSIVSDLIGPFYWQKEPAEAQAAVQSRQASREPLASTTAPASPKFDESQAILFAGERETEAAAEPKVAEAEQDLPAETTEAAVPESALAQADPSPSDEPFDWNTYDVNGPAETPGMLANDREPGILHIAQTTDDEVGPAPAENLPPYASDGDGESIADAPKLGDEPVNNQLQFLRRSTVLLSPGQWQFDVGLVYAYGQNDIPVVLLDGSNNITDVVEGQLRERELFVPFAFRYGLTRRSQVFVNAPVGWANTEFSFPGSDDFDHDGGIGDVTVGINYLVSHCDTEDIVFTFAGTAPTGGSSFDNAGLAFSNSALGEGFWALSGELLCIKVYDPVVVFTGIGTRQYFEKSYVGVGVRPGSEYRWQMGVGLSVNPKVTLSTRFFGSYITDIYFDNVRVPGTMQEPMSIRMAATIAKGCKWVEPFVDFGVNDDANTTVFGTIWTY